MITAADVIQRMQYSSATTEETLTFTAEGRAVAVSIKHDQFADSPYDSGDCMSPALWLSLRGRWMTRGGHPDGPALHCFFSTVSGDWVARHWRKLCGILDLDADTFAADLKAGLRRGGDIRVYRLEMMEERLAELRSESWTYGGEYLGALQQLYTLAGVPCETFSRNGYCQGDSIQGLVVMTREWAEMVGCPYALKPKAKGAAERCRDDMAAQADEFAAWVWGDCYGFKIEGGESMWGFVGSDPEKSGIAEAIAEAVNSAFADFAEDAAEAIAAARPDLAPAYGMGAAF